MENITSFLENKINEQSMDVNIMRNVSNKTIVSAFFKRYALLGMVEYKEGKKHEDYSSVTRRAFADYVHELVKNGKLTNKQASNIRLG